MSRWRPLIEPCPPQDRLRALEVLYQRVPESLRPRLISDLLQEVQAGDLDLSGLWVARDGGWFSRRDPAPDKKGRIVGSLLTQSLAGRAAAVWVPEVEPSLRRGATAAALVAAALANLRARGFRIAQAVLDESASQRGAHDLTRGGMPRLTELLYLERETSQPLALSGPGGIPPLDWRPFCSVPEADFRALLQATYLDSLDMPELEGVRSLDDVIEGHRATGRFVPDRWRLGQVLGQPEAAAILLLADIPDRNVWEVVYLGLTPPARGRGLGRRAIQHALDLARHHARRLELAVDIRNLPATRLYDAAGFIPFDRRSVHLAVFPRGGD